MNLRKEIEKIMQYDNNFYKAGTDELVKVFKQWALEIAYDIYPKVPNIETFMDEFEERIANE